MELGPPEVADIFRDDGRGSAGDGQLDKVVVCFVPQVGPPAVVDRRPAADAEEGVEESVALAGIETACPEQRLPAQEGFVLPEQRFPHEWLEPALQARPQHGPAGASRAEQGRHENVRIQNHHHTPQMIAYVLSEA